MFTKMGAKIIIIKQYIFFNRNILIYKLVTKVIYNSTIKAEFVGFLEFIMSKPSCSNKNKNKINLIYFMTWLVIFV